MSIENIHRAEHMAKSAALANLNTPAIDVIARILERGRADGAFRRDVDAIDLHMMISAFCVFRVANRHTFGTIFGRDLTDPALRERYRDDARRHGRRLPQRRAMSPGPADGPGSMTITFPGESADDPGRARAAARARGGAAARDGGRRGGAAGAAARRHRAGGLRVPGAPRARPVRLSELFAPGRDALVVYSMMFPRHPQDDGPGPPTGATAELPLAEGPCPSCTALLDQLDGAAEHAGEHLNFVVVAKAPAEQVVALARERGWRHLRVLSSAGNTYNRDYNAEATSGEQMPMLNVFHRDGDVSGTSGARSCSTRRPSRGRTRGTSARSSRLEHVRPHARGPRSGLGRAAQLPFAAVSAERDQSFASVLRRSPRTRRSPSRRASRRR